LPTAFFMHIHLGREVDFVSDHIVSLTNFSDSIRIITTKSTLSLAY
jgi:hypothetical protein